MHFYEVRPCKGKRGIDLISDALPFCRLSYGETDAISDTIGHAQSRRWVRFGIPCVLAIPPWPTLLHAQAREEEAEML